MGEPQMDTDEHGFAPSSICCEPVTKTWGSRTERSQIRRAHRDKASIGRGEDSRHGVADAVRGVLPAGSPRTVQQSPRGIVYAVDAARGDQYAKRGGWVETVGQETALPAPRALTQVIVVE